MQLPVQLTVQLAVQLASLGVELRNPVEVKTRYFPFFVSLSDGES